MTAAEKLDFLVTQFTSMTDLGTRLSAQLETLNRHMDSHDTRLACLEVSPGKQPAQPQATSGLGSLAQVDLDDDNDEAETEDLDDQLDWAPPTAWAGVAPIRVAGTAAAGGATTTVDATATTGVTTPTVGGLPVTTTIVVTIIVPIPSFHPSTVRPILFHGSPSVPHTFAVCAPLSWIGSG
jgi:hypothetical protein